MPSGNGQQRRFTDELLDRAPPMTLPMERQVIGSVMIAPDTYDEITYNVRLRPSDFHDSANGVIWNAISTIREKGRPLDPELLVQTLRDEGQLDLVGGVKYLHQVIGSVANGAHAVHYAKAVKDKSQRRGLINASTDSLRAGYDEETTPIAELIDQAESRLHSIADDDNQRKTVSIRDALQDAMEVIGDRKEGRNTGLRTGLCDLDNILGGMREGNVTLVAARPAMGKTALGLQIGMDVSGNRPSNGDDRSASVLFFSLEMREQELCERMLSSGSSVPSKALRNGVTPEQSRQLIEEMGRIYNREFSIVDDPGISAGQIASAARLHKRRNRHLDLIVIDYIQLIQAEDSRVPRQEQVAKISERIRLIAREMKIPILALAQLNRSESGKPPQMSNLRESGALEQDANQIIMIHRPAEYNPELRPGGVHNYNPNEAEEAELYVRKNRNGESGMVKVSWFAARTRFETPAPARFSEFDDFNQDRGQGNF